MIGVGFKIPQNFQKRIYTCITSFLIFDTCRSYTICIMLILFSYYVFFSKSYVGRTVGRIVVVVVRIVVVVALPSTIKSLAFEFNSGNGDTV